MGDTPQHDANHPSRPRSIQAANTGGPAAGRATLHGLEPSLAMAIEACPLEQGAYESPL